MTVISVFAENETAITDLLISKEKNGEYCSLPSLGDTERLNGKINISLVGLKRKVVYLTKGTEKATVFWAGTVAHVISLILAIKKLISDSDSDSDLQTIFDTAIYEQEQGGESDFEIIALINDNLLCRAFDSSPALIPYFGNVYSAGSGAKLLISWLMQRGEKFETYCNGSYELKRIRAQHTVPSILLEQDTRDTLKTISNGVGGYYERFEVSGSGCFSAIDQIQTCFIKLCDSHIELRRLFYHYYIEEVMVIFSVSELPLKLNYGQSVKIKSEDMLIYFVDCIDSKSNNSPNISKRDVVSNIIGYQALSLTIYSEDNDSLLMRFFNGSESQNEPPFEMFEFDGDLVIRANEKAVDYYRCRLDSSSDQIIDIVS